ncbi:MAG: hypothetical protein ACRET5_06005, partial [Steroidobacteraceae bacterium]
LGPLESLKRLVEQHLDSPALSPEFICARSGWSRIPAQPIADPGRAPPPWHGGCSHPFHRVTS